jgi:hypothetical protein
MTCIIFSTWLLACSSKTTREAEIQQPEKNKVVSGAKPPSSYADTMIIKHPSAVFFNTDSAQMEKIKAITKPAVFESMQHDCFYQMRNARNIITRSYPGIMINEIKNVRWILFINAKGSKELIDLNSVNDPCGIFLFDAVNPSRLADMTNIDTELGQYFSR